MGRRFPFRNVDVVTSVVRLWIMPLISVGILAGIIGVAVSEQSDTAPAPAPAPPLPPGDEALATYFGFAASLGVSYSEALATAAAMCDEFEDGLLADVTADDLFTVYTDLTDAEGWNDIQIGIAYNMAHLSTAAVCPEHLGKFR